MAEVRAATAVAGLLVLGSVCAGVGVAFVAIGWFIGAPGLIVAGGLVGGVAAVCGCAVLATAGEHRAPAAKR